ncbi:MAG: phage replisome organizer N-terminal domain-containing protein, partial [Clostridia bacterium]
QGGDTYTIIYLKMQLLSLENEGILFFENVENTFAEEIALEIDEDAEDVKILVLFLISNGMLEEKNTDEFMLTETVGNIDGETSSAIRVRRHRALKNGNKTLQCNADVTPCNKMKQNGNVEIELDIEIDKDIEKEKNKKAKSFLDNQTFFEDAKLNNSFEEWLE